MESRDEELWRIQSDLAEKDGSSFIPFNMKFRIYKKGIFLKFFCDSIFLLNIFCLRNQIKGNIKIIKGDFPEDNGEEYEDYDYNLHGTVIFIQEPGSSKCLNLL